MKSLFQYNWQVRDEWLSWCETISLEELLKPRFGGVGGILQTLFHVIVVEYSWICDLTGHPDIEDRWERQVSLDNVVSLSRKLHPVVRDFVTNWTDMQERRTVVVKLTGKEQTFQYGEVLRHVIAHEIHHIGQLSVWAREIGREPVSANLIGRGLLK
jgi:uncharacterized damage-inducible protein DinB